MLDLEPSSEPGESTLAVEGVTIVGIGASAGGLEAFIELLHALPPDTGMAFAIIQHLDPHQDSVLAELLASRTTMPVQQVHDENTIEANHIYVIPPNKTMVVSKDVFRLNPRPASEFHKPIDAFLVSLAKERGANSIGAILSGTASDGTLGLKAIKSAGGVTFCQDLSAKFDGMPRNAIAAGVVDFVLSPARIAAELAVIAQHPYYVRGEEFTSAQDGPILHKIVNLLRSRTSVDFAQYKRPTVQRRLVRRMALRRTDNLEKYYAFLQQEPSEAEALFEDLLINVTEFFRDPGVFASLRQHAFSQIVNGRGDNDPIRIWIPGCSSGEEIYSIAMAFLEFFSEREIEYRLQLFGTDVSDHIIDKARAGIYSDSAVSNLSPERLRRFFTRSDAGYQISRAVREMCVFSRHNITRDPPLSRMDLISCRNLLIYLTPPLQRRVVSTLGYALRPSGCLVLGSSETLGTLSDHFLALDAERRIFQRKPDLRNSAFDMQSAAWSWQPDAPTSAGLLPPEVLNRSSDLAPGIERYIDRMLLNQYGPSGIVVDKAFQVVEFRGKAGRYLDNNNSHVGADVFTVIRDDLRAGLRQAIEGASDSGAVHRIEGLEMRTDDGFVRIDIEVKPVRVPEFADHYLIVFTEAGASAGSANEMAPVATPADADRRLAYFEHELSSTREYLQAIIEELRATNEEAQSANEELQSTNEELQTAREELQSSNEELSTVNAEMLSRNSELALLNNDLNNLLSSMNTPIVILDRDLKIRRMTPVAESVLHLIPSDVGRPITDLRLRIGVANFEKALQGVVDTLVPFEQEVRDQEGRWYILRIRPYRTSDHRIEGAVIQMLDVGEIVRRLEEVRNARDYSEAIVDTIREPLLVLERSLTVHNANRSFLTYFRLSHADVLGKHLTEIADGQFRNSRLTEYLQNLIDSSVTFRDLELRLDRADSADGGSRVFSVNGGLIESVVDGRLLLVAFQDVTEQKQAAEARYRRLFESARDGIVIADAYNGEIEDVNPFVEHLSGYNKEELIGRPFWESHILCNIPQGSAELTRIREHEVARYPDIAVVTRDGKTLQSEIIANVYSEGDRRVIQFNMRDLTDRRKFERELQQTAKLESIGLLAGGIAHDFNNLLTGVLGNASLAYSTTPQGHANRTLLREISHAAERAALLTRQLLAYAGKGRTSSERIALPEFIQDSIPLVQTSIPRMVNVSLSLDPATPDVDADPGQIQQLLMNLVINAAEAIGEDKPGRIEVITGPRDVTSDHIAEHYSKDDIVPGKYALIEVTDNGSGMDEATKARIFDPFFTTKFTGRGLGLAAVLGIIRGHGGAVHVSSAPGRGTSFRILIPAARNSRPGRPVRAMRRRHAGSGTVLLIDDEQTVRDVTRLILQKAGFTVLSAENGERGVEMFRENADTVNLVLLDLLMPVMGGDEAFDRIREIRPDVAVVLMSGFEEEEAFRRFGDKRLQGFVKKPFTADWLCDTVLEALDR